ncbi:uncharacterized protein MYCFIDRAFT_174422 [Pseudocercospora fijiensis CIRAD86]|uniref:Zinc finger PHD-type domain-containing protein n=1 Tax=Pseudocercospora fijiensis (strain CIRAD86) TaxID=383855 RepID=M3AEA9_PSEFD|nr:uncharacterized protein MYCFIDRAFT_174422 [Pseudocercospora fijiensis CIRAD86]EME82911.1 hypothetical protein MYCFIDRAFT_174422 [Pseudocercospora fijiensis CIRAD86]
MFPLLWSCFTGPTPNPLPQEDINDCALATSLAVLAVSCWNCQERHLPPQDYTVLLTIGFAIVPYAFCDVKLSHSLIHMKQPHRQRQYERQVLHDYSSARSHLVLTLKPPTFLFSSCFTHIPTTLLTSSRAHQQPQVINQRRTAAAAPPPLPQQLRRRHSTMAATTNLAAVAEAKRLEGDGRVINEWYSLEEYTTRRLGFLGKHPAFRGLTRLLPGIKRDGKEVFKGQQEVLSAQQVRARELACEIDPLLPLSTATNTHSLDDFQGYPADEWHPGFISTPILREDTPATPEMSASSSAEPPHYSAHSGVAAVGNRPISVPVKTPQSLKRAAPADGHDEDRDDIQSNHSDSTESSPAPSPAPAPAPAPRKRAKTQPAPAAAPARTTKKVNLKAPAKQPAQPLPPTLEVDYEKIINGENLPRSRDQAKEASRLRLSNLKSNLPTTQHPDFPPEFFDRRNFSAAEQQLILDGDGPVRCVCGNYNAPRGCQIWIGCETPECHVWQHAKCMTGEDKEPKKETGKDLDYYCQVCDPWFHRKLGERERERAFLSVFFFTVGFKRFFSLVKEAGPLVNCTFFGRHDMQNLVGFLHFLIQLVPCARDRSALVAMDKAVNVSSRTLHKGWTCCVLRTFSSFRVVITEVLGDAVDVSRLAGLRYPNSLGLRCILGSSQLPGRRVEANANKRENMLRKSVSRYSFPFYIQPSSKTKSKIATLSGIAGDDGDDQPPQRPTIPGSKIALPMDKDDEQLLSGTQRCSNCGKTKNKTEFWDGSRDDNGNPKTKKTCNKHWKNQGLAGGTESYAERPSTSSPALTWNKAAACSVLRRHSRRYSTRRKATEQEAQQRLLTQSHAREDRAKKRQRTRNRLEEPEGELDTAPPATGTATSNDPPTIAPAAPLDFDCDKCEHPRKNDLRTQEGTDLCLYCTTKTVDLNPHDERKWCISGRHDSYPSDQRRVFRTPHVAALLMPATLVLYNLSLSKMKDKISYIFADLERGTGLVARTGDCSAYVSTGDSCTLDPLETA